MVCLNLKNEVQKLRADFNLILAKYSNESSQSMNDYGNTSSANYAKANYYSGHENNNNNTGNIRRSKSIDVPR